MNKAATHEIEVKVRSHYLAEQSIPSDSRYVFSYTVTIRNTGDVAAKLLTRHWIITDGNGKTEEVHGPGVIGEHPYLAPGESYEYSSGTVIETPIGAMHGHYDMVADDGETFKATIQPFSLAVPGALH